MHICCESVFALHTHFHKAKRSDTEWNDKAGINARSSCLNPKGGDCGQNFKGRDNDLIGIGMRDHCFQSQIDSELLLAKTNAVFVVEDHQRTQDMPLYASVCEVALHSMEKNMLGHGYIKRAHICIVCHDIDVA